MSIVTETILNCISETAKLELHLKCKKFEYCQRARFLYVIYDFLVANNRVIHYYSPPNYLTRMVLGERPSGDAPISRKEIEVSMKEGIHPDYSEFKATCSCGNVITVGSTSKKDIHLDVCSECHPFYTGKQKAAETGGRIDKFNKRFGALGKK